MDAYCSSADAVLLDITHVLVPDSTVGPAEAPVPW